MHSMVADRTCLLSIAVVLLLGATRLFGEEQGEFVAGHGKAHPASNAHGPRQPTARPRDNVLRYLAAAPREGLGGDKPQCSACSARNAVYGVPTERCLHPYSSDTNKLALRSLKATAVTREWVHLFFCAENILRLAT